MTIYRMLMCSTPLNTLFHETATRPRSSAGTRLVGSKLKVITELYLGQSQTT